MKCPLVQDDGVGLYRLGCDVLEMPGIVQLIEVAPYFSAHLAGQLHGVHLLSRALPVQTRGRGGDYFRFHVVSVVTVRTGPGPSAQQPGEQGNEGQANQGHAAARNQLFDTLRFCLCVIKKQ